MNRIPLFEKQLEKTPIVPMVGEYSSNTHFIKRDDMIPFSFGGNKARKAAEFYNEIINCKADVVMTYGSNSSNHCRIIANMAAAMGVACHIISPDENKDVLYNSYLVKQFGAVVETCPVSEVSATIENRKEAYQREGKNPFFIMGGGHGNSGTAAYVKAYREIVDYERENNIYFDYIFHASGTGTTQAGLVCGKLLANDKKRKIVGISIAREASRGREVIKDSIKDFLGDRFVQLYNEDDLVFADDYRLGGYGKYTPELVDNIKNVMKTEGIPMDSTYVGKAFGGMCSYIKEHRIEDKNILFIHTGGMPLFFDLLNRSVR